MVGQAREMNRVYCQSGIGYAVRPVALDGLSRASSRQYGNVLPSFHVYSINSGRF